MIHQDEIKELIDNSIVGISSNRVVVFLSIIPLNYIELVPGDDKKMILLAGTLDQLAGLINSCRETREKEETKFICLDKKKILAFS